MFLKLDQKAAFEPEWQNHLYTPEEMDGYPFWGICGRDGLVLVDADRIEMAEVLRKILPPTFEVQSPRRQLPHFYLVVKGMPVENKVLHLPDEKEGSGEVRAQNEYLVAPGTEITYQDVQTGKTKKGRYTILEDRPFAVLSSADFKKTIEPYLGSDSSQKITLEDMRKGVPKGTRHAKGIRYADYLIGVQHFDYTTALSEMIRWNKLCQPPMDEKDLERMVRNAIKYIASRPPRKEQPSKRPSAPKTDTTAPDAVYTPGFYDSKRKLVFEQVADHKFATPADGMKPSVTIDGIEYLPCERLPWETRLISEPITYGTAGELWRRVRGFIKNHVFLDDEKLYDVLTAWVFHTWIPETFGIVPYIFIHGPKNTGKTRLTKVLMSLSYRGILTPNTSEAGLFRIMETLHPTLFIDENSTLAKEVKAAVTDILNSGYERGSQVIRCNDEGELRYFDPFGPKAINGTKSIPDTLESRCIPVPTIRAPPKTVKRRIDERGADEIRSWLLTWRFNYLDIWLSEEGEGSEGSEGSKDPLGDLDSRLQDIFAPLMVVSNEGKESIVEYAKTLSEDRDAEEKTTIDAEIVSILANHNDPFILTQLVTNLLNSDRPESERYKSPRVGSFIKRLGYKPKHSNKGNGWIIDEKRLQDHIKTYLTVEEQAELAKKIKASKMPSQPSQGSPPSPLSGQAQPLVGG
jgi:hypothetical protein